MDLHRAKGRIFTLYQIDAEVDELQKGYTPESTAASTKWAMNNFLDWKQSRSTTADTAVPDDILSCIEPDVLSHWLRRFAAETRTQSGTQYPPATVNSLLAGVQRHMKNINPNSPTFLDKGDKRFRPLHNSLDVLFRGLQERNIGTSTSHHQPFTRDEINQLWECGVLGTDSPQSLLNAAFFSMEYGSVCAAERNTVS